MRNEVVEIALLVLALFAAAAAQDLSPTFGGAKIPLLLMLALHESMQPKMRGLRLATAAACGAFAEALSLAPAGSLVTFYLVSATLARSLRPTGAHWAVAALAPAACEFWMAAWGVGRTPAATAPAELLLAWPAAAIVFWSMSAMRRFAGVEREEKNRRAA